MSPKAQQAALAPGGTSLLTLSIDQFAGQFTKAVETGGALGRSHSDALERTIASREGWIEKQAEQIQALTGRVLELTEKLGTLAQKSLDQAVVEMKQQIGLAHAKDLADWHQGLLTLARDEVLPVLLPMARGLLPGAAAASTPAEVKDVLTELLSDEQLAGALIAKVGPEKFAAFADWAGRV